MEFLSTPSARRATFAAAILSESIRISIHALREEGDEGFPLLLKPPYDFYPRPPRGGRLFELACAVLRDGFLSTPSARRATNVRNNLLTWKGISIHALREEGDHDFPRKGATRGDFYPRPPRGGRRRCARGMSIHLHDFYPRPPRGGRRLLVIRGGLIALFLSTPSARRATAKTETKSLFSNKLYNILHEFRRALIYNGSKNYPNHAK